MSDEYVRKIEDLGAADHQALPLDTAVPKNTPSYRGTIALTIEGVEIIDGEPLLTIGTPITVTTEGKTFECVVDLISAESPTVRRWRARPR